MIISFRFCLDIKIFNHNCKITRVGESMYGQTMNLQTLVTNAQVIYFLYNFFSLENIIIFEILIKNIIFLFCQLNFFSFLIRLRNVIFIK